MALAITADGTKIPVGCGTVPPRTKTVVTALLADLVTCGLSVADGLLVAIDGAKALVQRRTLRKWRNAADHLPDKEQDWVDAKLVKAFAHPDPERALRNARTSPAAASIREGLEEMFTVARLGIDGRLAKTLTTSNPIESMISIARTTNRTVTRWRDGQMVLRRTAAGMLSGERSFRRVKGDKQIPRAPTAGSRRGTAERSSIQIPDERVAVCWSSPIGPAAPPVAFRSVRAHGPSASASQNESS